MRLSKGVGVIVGVVIALVFTSCSDEVLPKPKAFLRLEYPQAVYVKHENGIPYTFEYSKQAKVVLKQKKWIDIKYPAMKASIDITYRPVKNNLKELLLEAEKLTFSHAVKADGIEGVPYENRSHKVFGKLFEVTGNAATHLQFHLTDSSRHFITASLYFYAQPNYDSILPAVDYLKKDIVHLIESFRWKD